MSANKNLRDVIRNAAAADMFKTMSSQASSETAINEIRGFSDDQLNMMASVAGVPADQHELYRAMMRGEDNEFIRKLDHFENKLETGDIILVTGTSNSSKILANSQKAIYRNARSSHVVIVHADFICIDAIPSAGVSNRLVPDVFFEVEDTWRVIRFANITEHHREEMLKKCAFYLEQPYKILPKRKPAKKYSYCSELARKVYYDSNVNDCKIPKNSIIKPCDFDRLADQGVHWVDITDSVKPFIEFCFEYRAILKIASKLFVDGLKLNRSRNQERMEMIREIRKAQRQGKLSDDLASKAITSIHETDGKMNFSFWDSTLARSVR